MKISDLMINFIYFMAGMLISAFLFQRFSPKPSHADPVVQVQTKTLIKTVRVTEQSGKVIETTEHISDSSSKTEMKTRYRAYLGLNKSFGAGARLGNLPLFLEAGYSLDLQRVEARLSYEF